MKTRKKYLHASRYREETGTQVSYVDAKTAEEHLWWTFAKPPIATNKRACEEFIGTTLRPLPS